MNYILIVTVFTQILSVYIKCIVYDTIEILLRLQCYTLCSLSYSPELSVKKSGFENAT